MALSEFESNLTFQYLIKKPNPPLGELRTDEDIVEAMRLAPSKDDLFLDYLASEHDIYYAYLRDVNAAHPELALDQTESIQELDTHVMQMLYRDGYEYEKIIRIMSNSPSLIYQKEAYDIDRYAKVDAIETKAEAAGLSPDEYLSETHKAEQEQKAKAAGMTLEQYENVTGRKRPPKITDFTRDDFESIRWNQTVIRVTSQLSPLVTLPDVQYAKTINQFEFYQWQVKREGPDAVEASYKERYYAALKSILQRRPATHLDEANRMVVKIMRKSHDSDVTIRACLKHAPNLEIPAELFQVQSEEDYTILQSRRTQQDEAIDALLSEGKEGPSLMALQKKETPEPAKEDPDDQKVYKDMIAKLEQLRDSEKGKDVLAYWKNSMDVMRNAILQYKKAQTACRILKVWSVGAQKAAKEFGLTEDAEVQSIHDEAIRLGKKAELQEKEWETFYGLIEKADLLSQALIKNAMQALEKNPILKLPEVAMAKPLGEVIENNAPPKDLYFAALRKTALETRHGDIYDADVSVVRILKDSKIPDARIKNALLSSPRYQDVPEDERKTTINRWYGTTKFLLNKDQQASKGKDR